MYTFLAPSSLLLPVLSFGHRSCAPFEAGIPSNARHAVELRDRTERGASKGSVLLMGTSPGSPDVRWQLKLLRVLQATLHNGVPGLISLTSRACLHSFRMKQARSSSSVKGVAVRMEALQNGLDGSAQESQI